MTLRLRLNLYPPTQLVCRGGYSAGSASTDPDD